MALKVVFHLYGSGSSSYAEILVASCKRYGYEVWQLSDESAKEIENVDKVIRKPIEAHALFRFRHLVDLDPPYLVMDADSFVAKDISEIQDYVFDAVLTVRDSSHDMPYNAGVFWVNNKSFVSDCLKSIENMPKEKQEWFADQYALAEVSKGYKIKELSCSTWNFSPDSYSQFLKNVYIYHFKGPRKKMMKEFYERQYR